MKTNLVRKVCKQDITTFCLLCTVALFLDSYIIKFMYEIRVEDHFAAAHFLQDYHGKCESLHGHNYKVYAHVRGKTLDDGGMLLDFSLLKKAVQKACDILDHTNLNDLKNSDGSLVFLNNPSAERIAQWIFIQVQNDLKQENRLTNDTKLYAVDVFETEFNRARYIAN